MKLAHMARLCWVILFAEIAACSGKVALRYRPRRDAVHHYVVTMRYSRDDAPIVASVARTDQVWTIYYTQFGRFTDRGGAGSEVSLQIDSAQLQPSGADPDLPAMNGATILAFLDGRGQLQRTEPDTLPGLTHDMVLRLRAIAAAVAPWFPQEPVEPGDAWTVTTPAPLEVLEVSGQDSSKLQLHATLNALQKSVNDWIADVGINGQLPTVETRVTTGLGALAARSSGTMIGRYRFSLPRGVMIFEELSVRLTLVTDAPRVGRDTLLSRLVTQTTIRLQ
jgi:hypothetical protein